MLHRLSFENSRIGSESIEIDVPLVRAEMQVGKVLALAGGESEADIAAALEATVDLGLHHGADILHPLGRPSRIDNACRLRGDIQDARAGRIGKIASFAWSCPVAALKTCAASVFETPA